MIDTDKKLNPEASTNALRDIQAHVVGVSKQRGAPGKSHAVPDNPFHSFEEKGKVLLPPFDMFVLSTLGEYSATLTPAVDAYAINIDSFGHRFIPRFKAEKGGKGDKVPRKLKKAAQKEHVDLVNFFEYATQESFEEFRMRIRNDLEFTGNAYFEVVRGITGKIQRFVHLPSYQVRLTAAEDQQHLVKRKVLEMQSDGSVKIKERKEYRRFRKFLQSRTSTATGSGAVSSTGYVSRWFKEFGDPREYNSLTGDEVKPGEIPKIDAANEVVHMKLYSPRSPYGLPRFVGNLLSIYGDRAAEEINYMTFKNNNIPSMVLLVSNGQLTQGSIERINTLVESQIQGSDNYSKFLILEAEGDMEGEDGSQVKLDIKPLVKEQHKDALFQNYSKNNQDRIRQAFRLPPIFTGSCHSADTEYLTSNGWKLFDDIQDSDLLGTTKQDSMEFEFQKFSARHEYDFDGQLLHLKNNGVDAMVTPNHRMLTRATTASKNENKAWELVPAGELSEIKGANGGCIELPTTAKKFNGTEEGTFVIPANRQINAWSPDKKSKNITRDMQRYEKHAERNVSMDEFLKFLGHFISEGSTTNRRGPIVLSQNTGDIADSMVANLKELGFNPCVSVSSTRPNEANITISHVGLWQWLRDNCGTGSKNKKIPDFVFELSTRQIDILRSHLIDGDGSIPKSGSFGSFTYATASEQLNDQLYKVALMTGYTMTSSRNKSGVFSSYFHKDSRHLLHKQNHIEKVNYTGKVTCFTVPNGLLVTRRNGRMLVSGNSADYNRATAETSRRLADEQIFAPERQKFDNLMNRILFPEMGITYHKYHSNSPNTTDNTELVKILSTSEKTGGMTPDIARMILEDVLNRELGDFPEEFQSDVPFSMTMAEAVKNQADPAEPGQQVTALKSAEVLDGLVELSKSMEDSWRNDLLDADTEDDE